MTPPLVVLYRDAAHRSSGVLAKAHADGRWREARGRYLALPLPMTPEQYARHRAEVEREQEALALAEWEALFLRMTRGTQ